MKSKLTPALLYLISLVFFILGLLNPIMGSKLFMTFKRDDVYLINSTIDFLKEGEWFIGTIILVFTLILPTLKYLFLGFRLLSITLPKQKSTGIILELINKWAMLDVFVVALIIINLKFDSLIIVTEIKEGTTYFALSVLLLMTCSFILKKMDE